MKGQIARASLGFSSILFLTPGILFAQSTIAGVVRDTSGAVLPGVTVEASSPVLIEKVRTAVTDGEGAYKIIDLRPGLYTVSFALAGFSTFKRSDIDLPPAFTATVSVSMTVGSVEETVTVSGAAPLVDVENATAQRHLSPELLESLPASRSPQGFAALTPGVTSAGINTIGGGREEMNVANHGSRTAESLYLIDGVQTAQMEGVGGANNVFRISEVYVSEINVLTGGGTAEQNFSGTVTNVIPKEGGNSLTGSLYADYAGQNFQNDNLTPELRSQGLTSATRLVKLWDFSPAVGGRLIKDKLWFFSSYRNFGVIQTRAGLYENLTPLGWSYTPDTTRPAVIKITDRSLNTRLTWQATQKDKIGIFVDFQPHIVWQRGYQFSISPEATAYTPYLPNAVKIVTWKSVLTSRFLVDVSATHNSIDSNQRRQPGVGFDVISAVETSTSTLFRSLSTVLPAAGENYGHRANHGYRTNSSISYVTGSHAVKAGMQTTHGSEIYNINVNGDRGYSLRNSRPTSITEFAGQWQLENIIHLDLGLYAQDQWKFKRLTTTGGVRYDYLNIGHAAQDLPAGFFVPARSFAADSHAPDWRDFSPRLGVSYDVFGDGKTAIKASVGRYIQSQGAQNSGINSNNPVVRSVLQVTRTWNDVNGDFIPDCDLANPLANGAECGQISDLNFGQNNPTATVYADELLKGLRPFNLEYTVQVQRQLAGGVSVNVGYFRRVFGNFTASDNQFVTPVDYTQYCVAAPSDSRLPGGGGNQICGLYDLNPTRADGLALFGKNQTVVRAAGHYGRQSMVYDGFDLTENIRIPGGLEITGGVNIGRTKTNVCFVVDSPGTLRFCDITPPFQPNATFSGFAPLPWGGFVVSATYRNFPGAQITATQQYSNAEILPSLNRNLAAGVNGTVNVELIQPGTMYGTRQQQLDFRLSKRFRFGRRRLAGNLDIYNLLNATGISTINTTFGPNWQRPTLLQLGRYAKLSAQFDF